MTERISSGDDPNTSVSFYIRRSARDRVRAAYFATADEEGDLGWSDFLAKAALAEAERREVAHNDGEPFPAPPTVFRPGRWRTAQGSR